MRITGGTYRSLRLKSLPGEHTRPTLAKTKEAIFNRIGPYFHEGTMLDLFAGSGAMGLEGISRGMSHCYFSDISGQACQVIKQNIATLKVENQATVWKMDYRQVLKKCQQNGIAFDLIFIDPPYRKQDIHQILTLINDYQLANEAADIVVESLKEENFAASYGTINKVKEATYGITKITYYQKRSL